MRIETTTTVTALQAHIDMFYDSKINLSLSLLSHFSSKNRHLLRFPLLLWTMKVSNSSKRSHLTKK